VVLCPPREKKIKKKGGFVRVDRLLYGGEWGQEGKMTVPNNRSGLITSERKRKKGRGKKKKDGGS